MVRSAEAVRLVAEGAVRVLDVRTPVEYSSLGHIPGALLLPVDLIPVAVATLSREGAPWLVCCEHGVRSAHAAAFLARAGFTDVLDLEGGMSRWTGPRDHSAGDPFGPIGPSSWLVTNAHLLPAGGEALDLACGRGRHSLLLAAAGYRVTALDRDEDRIALLAADAARLGLPITAKAADLEAEGVSLGVGCYDLVLGIHYLHRPLFPAIVDALAPGGILLYETYTTHQVARGHPTNPAFLLEPGELFRLVGSLQILDRREGEFESRMVASVAARKLRA